MSSIIALREELAQVDEELLKQVQIQVDLEEKLIDQTETVALVKKHYDRLQRALDVLSGKVEDTTPPKPERDVPGPYTGVERTDSPASPPAPPVPPIPPKRPSGPMCSACGDPMIRLARTTRSGAYVEYWGCSDNKCGNEQY